MLSKSEGDGAPPKAGALAVSEAGEEAAPPATQVAGIKAFIPVAVPILRKTEQLPVHLYLKEPVKGFVPFRFAGTALRDRDVEKLLAQGIRHVYVDWRQGDAYFEYIFGQLPGILGSRSVQAEQKARLLYDVADWFTEDMAAEATLTHLDRARSLVRVLACQTLHGYELSDAMEELAGREFRPGAHILHVAIHGLHLGLAAQTPPHQVGDLALACLLHDIGKTADARSARQESRATDPNGSVDLDHPRVGAQRLRELCPRSVEIITVAAQHHERLDGRGFPQGLTGEKIHLWARICAIADAYDNLMMPPSAGRQLSPQEALARMEPEAGSRFDPILFNLFRQQIAPAPSRSEPTRPTARNAARQALPALGAERRRYRRFPYSVSLIVEGAKAGGGRVRMTAQSLDLSRGGIRFLADQGIGLGDDIWIHLPVDTSDPQRGYRRVAAVVVRCRPCPLTGAFEIGAQFVQP